MPKVRQWVPMFFFLIILFSGCCNLSTDRSRQYFGFRTRIWCLFFESRISVIRSAVRRGREGEVGRMVSALQFQFYLEAWLCRNGQFNCKIHHFPAKHDILLLNTPHFFLGTFSNMRQFLTKLVKWKQPVHHQQLGVPVPLVLQCASSQYTTKIYPVWL